MSKNVVLTLESRFMDEYGEYANLPVFNAHGSIVGYVGGEVPESGNPCEFNRLNDEGFTFCASATEVVRLKAENAKLREQMERLRTQLADVTKSVGRVEERCAKTFEVGKRWMAKAARFEAENAKLRELVREVWFYAEQELVCDDNCPYGASCDWKDCVFTRRMRELGVEVDG